jgi:hypothetical protein
MGGMIIKAISTKDVNKLAKSTYTSALDIPVKMLNSSEEAKPLSSAFEGKKAILFVNVATN